MYGWLSSVQSQITTEIMLQTNILYKKIKYATNSQLTMQKRSNQTCILVTFLNQKKAQLFDSLPITKQITKESGDIFP